MDSRLTEGAYYGGNEILDRLSQREREALLPHLHVYHDDEANVLRTRDQPIDAVHFPIDAVYSVVVELSQGHTYEVDVIGRGGVVGAEIAIGAQRALRTVLCQAGGRVAQLPCHQFKDVLARNKTFLLAVRDSLRRQWFDSQQTVACNFVHTVEQRAARWILMTQDQSGRDHFPMRYEYLAIMLGIPQMKVHEPIGVLTQLDCIRYADEYVTVISREALRNYVCECYELQSLVPMTLDGAD
jgi:CRP-like cAMP-binding protein